MGKKKGKSSNITLVEKQKVINVEYQLLVSERDDLLEAEIGYKRRIEQLEKENADTLKSFDILYNENKILRSKLDTPDGVGIDSVESYNAVYKDREHLREANRAFKRRINQLEADAAESQKSYNQLYQNHQLVTQRAQLETEYATKARDEKITEMETDHEEMTKKLKMFLKEREQYEYRIAEMDKERNELQNKYDFLAEEKHEFQLRCDVLQADREKLKQTIQDLEEKVPDPEVKAKEEQQYLSLQAQLVAFQVSNTDASKEIHKLKEEIRSLNKLKREPVEMVARASSPIVDEEDEENERQKEEKYAETHAELEESRKRGIHLLKENDRLKSETVALESKNANLELKLEELEKELNSKKTEIEDLSVLVRGGQSLNDDFLALQDKIKDLSATRQTLENELIQEKKMSKLKVMELNKDLEKTKDLLNRIEKDKMKSDGDNNRMSNENEILQRVNEAQALELRNMKTQLEQIQNIFEDKSTKYEDMKRTEKQNQEELRSSRLQLHIVRRELDDLRMEKAGNFNMLKNEMQTAKDERQEETEQMRQETIRLREEVKKLKDYEHKITTMDSEIRRLMNRLRVTDRFKNLPKKSAKGDEEKDEVKDLRKRQRELEKEKMILLQEKRQWEILKEKYADLQMNNRRLNEENKRVRGDLDGSSFKVDTLEKRFKKLNVKIDNDPNDKKSLQHATYIEKSSDTRNRKARLVAKKRNLVQTKHDEPKKTTLKPIEEESEFKQTTAVSSVGVSKARYVNQTNTKDRKNMNTHDIVTILENESDFKRSTVGGSIGISKTRGIKLTNTKDRKGKNTKDTTATMRSKHPTLPKLETNPGLQFGKGYKDLHKSRYNAPAALGLL